MALRTKGGAPVELRPEQADAVTWMAGREVVEPHGGVLADEMGMGKTYILAALIQRAELWPTLVVVPKSTIWEWAGVLARVVDQRAVVVSRASSAPVSKDAQLVLTTLSMFNSPKGVPEALSKRVWGRVAVDEAHVIKNPCSALHRALCALKAQSKWALTATPVHNVVGDLLALSKFAGLPTQDVALARELMLRRVHEPTALPPLLRQDVRLELLFDEERALSEAAERELAAKGAEASKPRFMELVLRCRHATTHPAVFHASMAAKKGLDDDAALTHETAAYAARKAPAGKSTKLDFLCEDLAAAAAAGEKSVVFCEWTDEMAVVRAMLEARSLQCVHIDGAQSIGERQEAVHQFNLADGADAMLLQMQCGACGLNLQAASRVYLLRPHWNPAVEMQAVGRAHRSGQTRAVTVKRLVAIGTVDETLFLDRQTRKLKVIEDVVGQGTVVRKDAVV
jgi:SNF2 family DNA or RNA helicase